MVILHVESSPGWGGQEMRTLKEAKGMRERGFDVVIGVEKGGGLVEEAKKEGFLVYELRFKKAFWIFSFFYLAYIVWKNKVKIINTHSSSDAWLGGVIGRLFRLKIIRTRHLSTEIKKGINSTLLYNYLADYVVTTCGAIVPKIISQAKIPSSRCKSIPTGVDESKMVVVKEERERFREKYGIQKTDFLIGTACFMRSWKGIEDFIKAADLLRDYSDIKWVIIGAGHNEKYVAMKEKLKLKNLFFTGHLSPPYAAIDSLNVFALLSTAHEGVSQASLQAAYLQKPIIGTVTGGIREVCIDDITGRRVPIFSPDKIAKAVLEMKGQEERCKEMGKRAKALVEEKFTHKKMLDEMQAIYDMLLIK